MVGLPRLAGGAVGRFFRPRCLCLVGSAGHGEPLLAGVGEVAITWLDRRFR